MSDWIKTITIPKNTPNSSPHIELLTVNGGYIDNLNVFFPSGVEGTAHVLIKDGHKNGVQIVPRNTDDEVTGDGIWGNIGFRPNYYLGKPYKICFVCWNTDLSNDHNVTIKISIRETFEFKRILNSPIENEGNNIWDNNKKDSCLNKINNWIGGIFGR